MTSEQNSTTNQLPVATFSQDAIDALKARAIDPARALADGHLKPVSCKADLPASLRKSFTPDDTTGVLIPRRHAVTLEDIGGQYRADVAFPDHKGDPRRYDLAASGDGGAVTVSCVRPPATATSPCVLVEAPLKAVAVAQYAPEGWGVYASIGCHVGKDVDVSWADGHAVAVLTDADTRTNTRVYDGAKNSRKLLTEQGATSVTHPPVPQDPSGDGKDGIDDFLARFPAEERAAQLLKVLQGAPATLGRRPEAKPKPKPKAEVAGGGRPLVDVSGDPLVAINALTDAVKANKEAQTYNAGGQLAAYNQDTKQVEHLSEGALNDLLARSACTFKATRQGDVYAEPTPFQRSAVASRAAQFPRVDRIVQVPFLRPDGSLCNTHGYDAATRTYLDLPAGLSVTVPDAPTDADVQAAYDLLMNDWLHDIPFQTEEDRTNYLGHLVTRSTRHWYALAPLFIRNGTDMEASKGLTTDLEALVFTGQPSALITMSDRMEEQRKKITATLATGPDAVVIDEFHVVGGTQMAALMTMPTWSDRLLGVSKMLNLPNTATWSANGNRVVVQDDMVRRYYEAKLVSRKGVNGLGANITYRHDDIRQWTLDNRGALLGALYTLVRTWVVRGRQTAPYNVRMGSFEGWQRAVEGTLQTAGRKDFLASLMEARTENNLAGNLEVQHLAWLVEQFKDEPFTAAQAATKATGSGYAALPGAKEEPGTNAFKRELGYAYRGISGQYKGAYRLVRDGETRNKSALYRVEAPDFDTADEQQAAPKPARAVKAEAIAQLRAQIAALQAADDRDLSARVADMAEDTSAAPCPVPAATATAKQPQTAPDAFRGADPFMPDGGTLGYEL